MVSSLPWGGGGAERTRKIEKHRERAKQGTTPAATDIDSLLARDDLPLLAASSDAARELNRHTQATHSAGNREAGLACRTRGTAQASQRAAGERAAGVRKQTA